MDTSYLNSTTITITVNDLRQIEIEFDNNLDRKFVCDVLAEASSLVKNSEL